MGSFTTQAEFKESYDTLFRSFAAGRTKDLRWRKWQLKQCWWMIEENQDRIIEALHSDLNRHDFETYAFEVCGMKTDILDNLANVEKWAQDDIPNAGFIMGTLGNARLRKEPLGVTFIMGAWNFPMLLCISPMVAAIAAGNCVLLKPSDVAPATQALVMDLSSKYLDQSCIRTVTGGPSETSFILSHKFNHIFYTGSNTVGKIVASAAAKHLCPVVLELGGQCPSIVTSAANVELAAKRIAAAKLMNGGQICVNVNHVFVDPSIHDQFVSRLTYWTEKFLESGQDQFVRIINERHYDRISGLLKGTSGDIAFTGASDRATKFFHPTIVKNVTSADSLMSEEIFGPITPVITADVQSAIQIINSMPHPLALYIFSGDSKEVEQILGSTTSGGVTINDAMIHPGVPNAPFGGVGDSGTGSYHGEFGFRAFSHLRTVVSPPTWLERLLSFRYAPFSLANAKYMHVKNNQGFKPGERLEDQTVHHPSRFGVLSKTIVAAVCVAGLLATLDSPTRGWLLGSLDFADVGRRLGLKN